MLSAIVSLFAGATIKSLESEVISVLASEAVNQIEGQLLGKSGQVKKQAAIEFIIDKIKLPFYLAPFKSLIVSQLSGVIDQGIESAVTALKAKVTPPVTPPVTPQ
jgi:hypothetical protein